MASLKSPTVPKLKAPKMGSAPKVKPPVLKGAPVAKLASAPKMQQAHLPSDQFAPRKRLAKAAAGASYVSGKRNPNYPTP